MTDIMHRLLHKLYAARVYAPYWEYGFFGKNKNFQTLKIWAEIKILDKIYLLVENKNFGPKIKHRILGGKI